MRRVGSALLLLASVSLLAGGKSNASAAEPPTGLQHWWQRMNADIDALVEANRLVPPTPVALRFRARRIWSGVLPGDLLDLDVADLGADDQDELVALTANSVLVLSRRRGLFDVRQRVDLPETLSSTRARDAIGMLAVRETSTRSQGLTKTEVRVLARSSEQGAGGAYVWRDGALVLDSEFFGYALCDDGTLEAAPGRNYFIGASALWSAGVGPKLSPKVQMARCSRGLVDPTGEAIRYVSNVSLAGTLSVHCDGRAEICSPALTQYDDVGYAHLVTDLNNDGHAEIVTTQASAQSDADKVQVFSQGHGEKRLLFEREFERGIVALTAGDFDGDGALELLAAERQAQPGRVSLWLLN